MLTSNLTKEKKHISIITMGGIGTGAPGLEKGIPVILSFLDELALKNNLIVFSLSPIHKEKCPSRYMLLAPKKPLSKLTKIIWLVTNFYRYRHKINIIHAIWGHPQGALSILLKKIFKKPVLIHLQGGDSTYIPELNYGVYKSTFQRWLVNWAYSRADELVVLSEFQKRELQKNFKKRIPKVISFGLEIFQDFNERKNIKPPYQIIHIGHLNLVKDQRTLLKAFESVTKQLDAKLSIIGEDTLNRSLQEYARELGLLQMVEFMGVVPHEEVQNKLFQSHLLVHSSVYEAQALVVNEAISVGIPVCCTHVGIAADLSGDITTTSPVGNSEKLAKNMLNLLNNQEEYNSKARKGLEWAKDNSMRKTVSKFNTIYNSLKNCT